MSSYVRNKRNNLPDVNDKIGELVSVAKSRSESDDVMPSNAETKPISNEAASTAKSSATSSGNQSTENTAKPNIEKNNKEQLTDSVNPKINLNENTPTQPIDEKHNGRKGVSGEVNSNTDASLQPLAAANDTKSGQIQDATVTDAKDSTVNNITPIDTLTKKDDYDKQIGRAHV